MKLLILKYKSFATFYNTFVLNINQKANKMINMKYSHILLYINNAFNKLIDY